MKYPIKLIMFVILATAITGAVYLSLKPERDARKEAEAVPKVLVLPEADAQEDSAELPPVMYLRADAFDAGCLHVTVLNHSGFTMNFNNGYRLERRTEDGWRFMELEDAAGHAIAVAARDSFALDDGEKMEFALDLSVFGEIGRGEYRISLDSMSAEFALA